MQEKIFTFLHPPVTPFFFLQTAKGLTHRSELVRQGSSGPGLTHGAKFAGTGACRICRAYEAELAQPKRMGTAKGKAPAMSIDKMILFYSIGSEYFVKFRKL